MCAGVACCATLDVLHDLARTAVPRSINPLLFRTGERSFRRTPLLESGSPRDRPRTARFPALAAERESRRVATLGPTRQIPIHPSSRPAPALTWRPGQQRGSKTMEKRTLGKSGL